MKWGSSKEIETFHSDSVRALRSRHMNMKMLCFDFRCRFSCAPFALITLIAPALIMHPSDFDNSRALFLVKGDLPLIGRVTSIMPTIIITSSSTTMQRFVSELLCCECKCETLQPPAMKTKDDNELNSLQLTEKKQWWTMQCGSLNPCLWIIQRILGLIQFVIAMLSTGTHFIWSKVLFDCYTKSAGRSTHTLCVRAYNYNHISFGVMFWIADCSISRSHFCKF